MTRIPTARPFGFATALLATCLALTAAATAAGTAWIDDRFDPFEEDTANVESVQRGEVLAFVLQAKDSSFPAEMSSDVLPFGDDFDEDLLETYHGISLYGGLEVETGVDWVLVQLEGDSDEIHDAILERLDDLGIRAEEDGMIGGPVRSYQLTEGDDSWRIAISGNGEGALVHLQAMY